MFLSSFFLSAHVTLKYAKDSTMLEESVVEHIRSAIYSGPRLFIAWLSYAAGRRPPR